MASPTAYDLVVLIDPEAPEERRSSIVDGVRKQLNAGDGALKNDVDWGIRRLAFEIRHRPEAHYHLFQLEAEPDLLKQIRHNLAIDDGVLRHRLIRLDKGAPDKPPAPPSPPRQAPRAEETEAVEAVAQPEGSEQPEAIEQPEGAEPAQDQPGQVDQAPPSDEQAPPSDESP